MTTPHSDPAVRRAQRVLSMVHELHKQGYQRIRIMPGMSPSGAHWRCSVTHAGNIRPNHGAHIVDWDADCAHYTSGQDNAYFEWPDAAENTARQLAEKFLQRFPAIARAGLGTDWAYAGWYTAMLGVAETGALPIAYADYGDDSMIATTGKTGVRLPLPPVVDGVPPAAQPGGLRFMPVTDFAHPGLVQDPHWTALIPVLHAALANPAAKLPMPAAPPAHADLFDHCAYWETCVYLMTALLGWSNPAKGLLWFYRSGMADGGDPRLQLLRDVWNSHGQLDLLAAWLWQGADCFPPLRHLPGTHMATPTRDSDLEPTPGWMREFQTARLPTLRFRHPLNPLDGGHNALHLGHSFDVFGGRTTGDAHLTADTAESGRATLTLDAAPGWYGQLATLGAELRPLPGKSWFVDVVVKPVGWLGTFRRSHLTGLWYLGRHSTHLAGQ